MTLQKEQIVAYVRTGYATPLLIPRNIEDHGLHSQHLR